MKRILFLFIIFLTVLLPSLTAEELTAEEELKRRIAAGEEPPYLSYVDGLHVTGQTIGVDIDSYRLKVSGAVRKPLELSIDQIMKMDSVRVYMELECPGFFLDKGHWTGVRVRDVLDLVGVSEDARQVKFIAMDGSYYSRISLDLITKGDVLLAYSFEDEPFPPYHGFPLRVAAKNQPGSYWVKWLGGIEVLE